MNLVKQNFVGQQKPLFKDKEKPGEVRKSNILAARSVCDAIRTSLGPKGMDKMIRKKTGEVLISNDGATILKHMAVLHPAAKILVDISVSQDSDAGDGTTSVVILTGSLLAASERLLNQNIHPILISEYFQKAAQKVCEIFSGMSHTIDIFNTNELIKAATTSLSSKIVSQNSAFLAPLAVESVMKIVNHERKTVNLNDIRLIKKVGGTIENTELVNGVVLNQNVVKNAGGPTRMEKAKIGLIKFQISSPKSDTENNIFINDYRQMDKILKEERKYLLNICKKIKKTKCNVLLIQKSILRDAVNELALHFLSKLNIMVIRNIERDEVEYLAKSLGCTPIADIESFTEDKLGSADLVDEVESFNHKILQITNITSKNVHPNVSIVIRGGSNLILDEIERSIHDALCVVRCLIKQNALIVGGGALEIEASRILHKESFNYLGIEQFIYQEFAQALEIIPITLAENAGLNPIEVISDLKNKHENGHKNYGISVRRSGIANMFDENVLQPLLVNTSAVTFAAECVKSILRIDDIVISH